MVDIKTIIPKLNRIVLGGVKIPHCVSNPVFRLINDKLYIAAFVYIYNRENIQTNCMPRPIHWILADIVSGDVIQEYDCRTNDFSNSLFGFLYDLNDPYVIRPSREEFDDIYSLFDMIRIQYIENSFMNYEMYYKYFHRILEITPHTYQRFYKELSNIQEGGICLDG